MQALPLPKVLVVDDERAQMNALCDTLGDHGFQTLGFSAGGQALEALKAGGFDLLLADLMMPEMDGIALLQAALALDANLVCIIMTGNGTIATAVEAMQVGALDYILKPFKLSAVLPVLNRALAVRKLRLDNAKLQQRVQAHTEELEAANAELERAHRSKDHFMATMSHELRTPLNAVLGYADMLLLGLGGTLTAEQQKHLGVIKASGEHMLSLINDLLDLARIESGRMELNPEPVVCQALVDDVIASLQVLAAAKGLSLDGRMPATEVCLYTDRRALFQILVNLANNAIKYTDAGGVAIELSQGAGETGPLTRISVVDTGVGITREDQAKLFAAFAQVGKRDRRTESTGLGLYLSAELANLMGGRITLDSEPGRGSTFTVSLPGAA
jgi:signal transduction histidine kinase